MTSSVTTQQYTLSNEKVCLSLDENGRLSQLTNRQTNHSYVTAVGHAPWHMGYRLYGPMEGALDLEIDPDDQHPTITQDADGLTLAYASLTASLPHHGHTRELQVGLTLHISLADDTFLWTAVIENREQEPGVEITEIWLPWINGLTDLGLGQTSDVLYWPEGGGRRIENPHARIAVEPTSHGNDPALRLTYPWPACMQWYTLNNGEEGIYLASYDRTLMTSCFNVVAHPGQTLSASIVKYPFVKAGETWTSETAVLKLYCGDWHVAANTYRAWADTWMQKPNPPDWLRRATGWMLVLPKGQSGHIFMDYSDLPDIMKEAQDVGLDMLLVFGWVKQGFDNLYPEYDLDEAMGGREGLEQALTQIRADGGRTLLYTQGQLIDPSTDFYRNKGKHIAARDIWGYEYRETYGGGGRGTLMNIMKNKYFGVACPGADGWLEQLESQADMVADLDAQGILFDQMGGIPPYICFSDEHPHAKPSLAVGPAKVHNMQHLRDKIKARDPEHAFVIELVTDCYAGYVDIMHAHGIGFWPEPEAYGEMVRYTFPELIITNRGDASPYDRRTQLGHAFALGWRFDGRLGDARDPELAVFLRRMCDLRKLYPDLLLEGKFVDNEGFVCSNSQINAYAALAGDKMAVTLWNATDLPQMAQVVAPGYQLERVHWLNPDWSSMNHTLLAGEVAVLIFQRSLPEKE